MAVAVSAALPSFGPMQRERLIAIAALAGAATLAACGGGDAPDPGDRAAGPVIEDPGPVHVHGLGVNPADGSLFIATHTGLFRSAPGTRTAKRVGDRYQDTMGFTVTGPDRFLGSGHPDGRDGLPPFLGLIRSTDAGREWDRISLLGEADFHVLEAVGRYVYGHGTDFESRRQQLLASDDGGRTWVEREPPEPLLSLAVDPRRPTRLTAAGQSGLFASTDGGRTWRPLEGAPGLLSWAGDGTLYRMEAGGVATARPDGGRTWEPRGSAGGEPAAFEAAEGALYVALHDGTIQASQDGGRSWAVRSRP